MSMDPKKSEGPPAPASVQHRDQRIRIFTWPKVIFMFPTLIAALICGVGMTVISNRTEAPSRSGDVAVAAADAAAADASSAASMKTRGSTPENLMGVLFLVILGSNLLIMGIDFPRFTVVGIILLILFALFFVLWLGAAFNLDLRRSVSWLFGNTYTIANSGFYFTFAAILTFVFAVVYVTRWLDYWVIMPNEILHHHGPMSDLERYPTLNLKFDKEIPDVFEFLFLGAGRLVLHVSEERKSIVLDNVLFINAKEEGLKKLMSRLEVRITSDQEISDAKG